MTQEADPSRRTFIVTATTAASALAVAAPTGTAADAPRDFGSVPAFQASDSLKPLPFDPAKLGGLSERLVRSHWENNYGGSVKALAVVKKRLAQALGDKDLPPYVYNDLKREHLVRTGSVVLHEFYFDNLGGSGQAGTSDRQTIAQAFGSFDTWETEFRRIGAGLGGVRAGWCSASTSTRASSRTIGWPTTRMLRRQRCRYW